MRPPPQARGAKQKWDRNPRTAVLMGWLGVGTSAIVCIAFALPILNGVRAPLAFVVPGLGVVMLGWSLWFLTWYRRQAKGSDPEAW